MADKSISELVAATSVGASDLFVLQQSNTAKKLTGQTLENWLLDLADGHGGIQSIAKTSTADLVDTYTVTLSDLTTYTFTVTNGKGVASVQDYWAVSTSNVTVPTTWQTTVQTMTVTNRYLWHYQVFTLNDSTTTPTTLTTQKSVVGVYGDTGDDWYVRIRFADIQPTRDEDMYPSTETSGHPWIGLYSGTDETIPEHYTSYLWYKYKGDKGDTGNPSTLTATEIKYGVSNSESLQPTEWTDTMPTVVGGQYLWTRTTLTFNTGSPVIFYSKARWGTDGTGSGTVTSVNEISPVNGNVTTMITGTTNPTTATIGQAKQVYLNTVTGESFVCTGASGGTYTWKDLRGHVDNALSTTSEYPVQNKIVKTAIDEQSADIVALEKAVEPNINQWDERWELGYINYNTGSNGISDTSYRSTNYIPCTPNTVYYAKSSSNLSICFYDSSKTFLGTSSWISASNSSFTSPANASFLRFYSSGTTYNNDISINYPSTYTGYYPAKLSIVNANQSMISDAWNSATTYQVGQYCISGNQLYKCKVQHSNQKPPNATYWDAVSVGNEISSIITGTFTPVGGSSGYIYKCGRVCVAVLNAIEIPTNTWTSIGTVNFKPSDVVSVYVANATVNSFGRIDINSDTGVVQVYHSIGSINSFFNATITYLTKD